MRTSREKLTDLGEQTECSAIRRGFKFMTHARLENWAALAAAAALAFLLGSDCAIAQAKGGKLPGPEQKKAPAEQKKAPAEQKQAPAGQQRADVWYKLCGEVPVQEPVKPGELPKQQKPEDMKKTAVCLTQADVRDNVTAMLVAKLVVRQIAGQPKPQLVVMLPLQSAIPPGALVKLDEMEPIRLAYTTCDRAGCYAEGNIEPSMVDQMKSGKQVIFAGIHVSGRPMNVPLPLEGFAKAIDGPPIPPEKYMEDQRKLAALIQARLEELRKKQEEAQGGTAAQPAAASPPPPANPGKKGK
jgi:invasion protein IalB